MCAHAGVCVCVCVCVYVCVCVCISHTAAALTCSRGPCRHSGLVKEGCEAEEHNLSQPRRNGSTHHTKDDQCLDMGSGHQNEAGQRCYDTHCNSYPVQKGRGGRGGEERRGRTMGMSERENREFKITIHRTNVKTLRHNMARDHLHCLAVCRSHLYV